MISARQVFLAIQYLDPAPLVLGALDTEQVIAEEDIFDEEVFQAIQYLDPDLEDPPDLESPANEEVFHLIRYLDPDLDRQPIFELHWLSRIRRSSR